jgi:hypothetical protein
MLAKVGAFVKLRLAVPAKRSRMNRSDERWGEREK